MRDTWNPVLEGELVSLTLAIAQATRVKWYSLRHTKVKAKEELGDHIRLVSQALEHMDIEPGQRKRLERSLRTAESVYNQKFGALTCGVRI